MGRNNAFLLDHGDQLRLSDSVTLIYNSITPMDDVQLTPVQEQERNTFAQRYLVTGRLLGQGGYGKVLVGIQQDTQRQLACKVIKIDHLYDEVAMPSLRVPSERQAEHTFARKRWPKKIANCFREFNILKDLCHPNIVTIEKVFWSHSTIYIFQELVTGGDLFSFLEYKGGCLNSMQAAVIIRQILKGIEYLHDKNIVHRDLKPDNILMTSLEDGARVVITDFGNARSLPTQRNMKAPSTDKFQRMFSYVGTLEFAAPEIHGANRAIPVELGYSKSVDMWSIGSITATLLTGDVIFTDRNHPDYNANPRAVIVALASVCDLSVLDDEDHPLWSAISNRPKRFIKELLVLDEERRLTAAEALVHPWFSSYAEDFEDVYLRSIKDWEPRRKSAQLVEQIPRLIESTDTGQVQQVSSCPAHSLASSGPESTHSMLQKLSASQCWRTNTPLPSIRDDYDKAQFASPVQPFSNEDNNATYDSSLSQDANDSQNPEAPCRTYSNAHASGIAEHLQDHNSAMKDTYRHRTSTREDSYGSCQSLNDIMYDYSQGHHLQTRDSHTSHPRSLLSQVDESYQQTRFPEEYRQLDNTEKVEQDSFIVHETPT